MNPRILLPPLLIVVVLVSGCVGQLSSLQFGSDVVKPSRTTTSVGPVDAITIENARLIPASPLLPTSSAQLMINIVSKETDPRRNIENVVVDLFDAGLFKTTDNAYFCNDQSARATEACNFKPCGPLEMGCILRPGEVRTVSASFRAPTETDIANIISRTSLNYRAQYNYKTTTSYDILLVTFNEIKRLQQEGQSLATPLQDTRGPGPVKIEATALTAFVIASAETPQDAYISLKLRNAGSGSIVNYRIGVGMFAVSFPSDLVGYGGLVEPAREFSCGAEGLSWVCRNTEEIELFRKESTPYQFIIRNVPSIDVPYRTFTTTAEVAYTYEARGSYQAEIRPVQIT